MSYCVHDNNYVLHYCKHRIIITSSATTSTRRLMFAEERIGHAKTSVHTQDVTMIRQLAFVCIRRCSAPGLIQDPQHRPKRFAVDKNIPACPVWWSRSEKRVHTGIFSLSGFSCSHARTPERNSVGNLKRHRGHDRIIYFGNFEDSDALRQTNRRNQTHSTSMGHTGGTERLHTSTNKMRHAG